MKDRYLHIVADNNPSGNPQRLFAIWHGESELPEIIDEGYTGNEPVKGMANLGTIHVAKSEYHRILKQGLI